MKNYKGLYINGQYIERAHRDCLIVENPATEEIIGELAKGDQEDINRACQAAQEAFQKFKNTSLEERISYVQGLHDYIECHQEDIALTIQRELGAPYWYALQEHVINQNAYIPHFIQIARDYPFFQKRERSMIIKEPIGVIACITPWNYPLGQILQKIVNVILGGNTMVLKPSSVTPLTAFYVAEGLKKAGLPNGVFNIVCGSGSKLGHSLIHHPYVRKISFTGSTASGRFIYNQASESIKQVTLELGGKSPALFIDDSKLDQGISACLSSILLNSGQTCSAYSRAIVLEKDKEMFEEKLLEAFVNYRVGLPQEASTQIGPLSSCEQKKKVSSYIDQGKKEGEVLIEYQKEVPKKGYFVKPIIFKNLVGNSDLIHEEIFGPVLVVQTAKTIEEMIYLANDTAYGLAAGVYGEEEQALQVAKKLQAGFITINDSQGDLSLPFGGYKMSGLGREGGREGLEAYLETKAIDF